MSLTQFIEMGGFGFYVWTAYGVAAAVLVFNASASIIRHRRVQREIKAWLKRQ